MKTLTELLDDYSVLPPDTFNDAVDLSEWWCVVDTDGVRAYFADEASAFAFRLMLINMRLNGSCFDRANNT